MAENFLSPENYYDNYGGWNLELMHERIKEMKISPEVVENLKSKEKSNLLMLGSATPANLNAVSKIDSFLRPGKVEQDTVVIIDQNMHPLEQHKKEVEWIGGKGTWDNKPLSSPEFPYPDFQLAQADMKELPFEKSKFDVIISDYTLNFLNNLEDVDATFKEISRTLSKNGIAIMSFRGNEKYSDMQADYLEGDVCDRVLRGVTVHYFPMQTYFKVAKRHGLKIESFVNSTTDVCAILNKV